MSGECSRYVSNGSWQGFSDDGKQRGLWCAVFVWFQHFLLKSLRGQRRRSLFCPSPPSLWAPVKELRILQYHPCLLPSWSTLLLLRNSASSFHCTMCCLLTSVPLYTKMPCVVYRGICYGAVSYTVEFLYLCIKHRAIIWFISTWYRVIIALYQMYSVQYG